MHCDYELLAHKLQRWNNYITNYHLPEWDAIPDFGLYRSEEHTSELQSHA